MSDEHGFVLPPSFTPAVGRDLTDAVKQAYADIGRTHDPMIGNDAITFGISVARAVWYRLGQRFAASSIFAIEHPEGSFELHDDSRTALRPFKIGNVVEDNVWTSFPWNQHAAHTMASVNAEQIGLGLGAAPRRLILGHFGSPAGFAKLYVCVPMFERSGKIFQWAAAIRIDDANSGMQEPARPAPALIAPPRVRLRAVPIEPEEPGETGDTAEPGDA